MSIMLSKTYHALKAAGAPETSAQAAAEELASYDNRLDGLESDVKLLKWMGGFNLAGTLTLVFKVLMFTGGATP